MLHRVTATIDKERTWEKVLNLDYLLSFEPYADKNGIYIVLNLSDQKYKFHYTSIDTMMEDYEKLHTNMSESFTQIHSIINPMDVSTENENDVLLG